MNTPFQALAQVCRRFSVSSLPLASLSSLAVLLWIGVSCAPEKPVDPQVIASSPSGARTAAPAVSQSQTQSPFTADQQTMFTLINKVRATGCKCGSTTMRPVRPLLSIDPNLNKAAQDLADGKRTYPENYLVFLRKNYFFTASSGNEYLSASKGFTMSVTSVFNGNMGVEARCKLIMDPNMTLMGYGSSAYPKDAPAFSGYMDHFYVLGIIFQYFPQQ